MKIDVPLAIPQFVEDGRQGARAKKLIRELKSLCGMSGGGVSDTVYTDTLDSDICDRMNQREKELLNIRWMLLMDFWH